MTCTTSLHVTQLLPGGGGVVSGGGSDGGGGYSKYSPRLYEILSKEFMAYTVIDLIKTGGNILNRKMEKREAKIRGEDKIVLEV